jgi:hypothetical protein
LKDNAKQNKDKSNNNIEHKQNTIEGGEVLIYGLVSLIVVSRKENFPLQTPNNTLIFVFNVHNNIQESHK